MSEATGIHDIEERLHDLSQALREAQRPDIALELEEQALDFTDPARVRPAVNQIRARLEHWRARPEELPESAKVHYSANRLEDACRAAMKGGVIVAARPSIATQSRRKLGIALVTLLVGSVVLLIPIVLMEFGVDLSEIGKRATEGPIRLPQGEEGELHIATLEPPLVREAATGVAFQPLGDCAEPLPDGSSCAEAPARLWPEGRLPTYELKLPHQAYGLLFSITDPKLDSGRGGQIRVLLAATDETPEGQYELPLSATYFGYTPLSCSVFERLQGECPQPRRGKGERHEGVEVPVLIVQVEKGDPASRKGEKRREQAEAQEARQKAEERARELAGVISEVQSSMDDNDKLMRSRRWEEVRERLRKLDPLFEPLRAVPIGEVEAGVEVQDVCARFDKQESALAAFEQTVFDKTYQTLTSSKNRRVPEAQLMSRLAKQFRISPEYIEELYTERADELQRRLDAEAAALTEAARGEQEAREARCGPLPTGAWSAIDGYLRHRTTQGKTVLGECMTPRLTDKECWEVRCDYERHVEIDVTRPLVVSKHSASFYLAKGKVVRQR